MDGRQVAMLQDLNFDTAVTALPDIRNPALTKSEPEQRAPSNPAGQRNVNLWRRGAHPRITHGNNRSCIENTI